LTQLHAQLEEGGGVSRLAAPLSMTYAQVTRRPINYAVSSGDGRNIMASNKFLKIFFNLKIHYLFYRETTRHRLCHIFSRISNRIRTTRRQHAYE
jgi:hypothetical protein